MNVVVDEVIEYSAAVAVTVVPAVDVDAALLEPIAPPAPDWLPRLRCS